MEPDSTFEGCDFFPTKGTITSNEGGNHMDLIKIGKYDLLSGETDSLSKNDYMYLFSYEFCKE